MDIEQLKEEHADIDRDVVERVEYLLYALSTKLSVVKDEFTGKKHIELCAANNKKGYFDYNLFITIHKTGMVVSFEGHYQPKEG